MKYKEILKGVYYGVLHAIVVLTSIVFVTTTIGFNLPLAFVASAIGTLVFRFVTKGELNIITGISGSYIAGLIAVSTQYGYEFAVGGSLLAGLAYLIVGLLIKKFPRILNLFPKFILSTAIIFISLNLIPIGVSVVTAAPFTGLITLIFVLLFTSLEKVKTFAFPLAIIVGTLFHAIVYGLEASTMATELVVTFPKFNLYSFTLIGSVAFAVMFECLADTKLMADTVGKELKPHRVIIGNGLATIAGSLFGSSAVTSYTESVAYVRETKHYSGLSIYVASATLLLLGLIPQLSVLVSYIPSACFGAVLIYLFSSIFVSNISSLEFNNERQMKVIIVAMASYFITPVVLSSVSPIAIGIVVAVVSNKLIKQ